VAEIFNDIEGVEAFRFPDFNVRSPGGIGMEG